jgi:hypothetical protein
MHGIVFSVLMCVHLLMQACPHCPTELARVGPAAGHRLLRLRPTSSATPSTSRACKACRATRRLQQGYSTRMHSAGSSRTTPASCARCRGACSTTPSPRPGGLRMHSATPLWLQRRRYVAMQQTRIRQMLDAKGLSMCHLLTTSVSCVCRLRTA